MHIYIQRRVTIRRHNYFYTPIEGTPFSLGLALPENYGMFQLKAEQEIKRAIINGKRISSNMSSIENEINK